MELALVGTPLEPLIRRMAMGTPANLLRIALGAEQIDIQDLSSDDRATLVLSLIDTLRPLVQYMEASFEHLSVIAGLEHGEAFY